MNDALARVDHHGRKWTNFDGLKQEVRDIALELGIDTNNDYPILIEKIKEKVEVK